MQKEGVLKINNWYFYRSKSPKMIQKLFILNGRRQNAAHRADVGIKSRRNRRRGERFSYPPNLADAKEESLKIIEYILFFTKKSFFICICAIFVVILYPI